MRHRRFIRRAFCLAALAAAGVTGAVFWHKRDQLRAEWDSHGVAVTHTDGTPRGDVSGAPYGLASDVRSRQGVIDDVRAAPPPWEPAALTWLANWQPAAPSTPLTRALGVVWASPMSLAGLLVGFASGSRPQRTHGILLFTGAGGIVDAFLRRRGFTAATWGHVVLCRTHTPSARLLAHEFVHTRQAERLGPLMPIVYLGLMPIYGYSRHPLERAARLEGTSAGAM